MSTRSSSSNLVRHFMDPKSVIRARRRNLGDPSLLLDFEEINMNPNNVQGPPPPTMNGRGRRIAPVNIQATDFGLKNHMIQQVQNSCQFYGLPGDDAKKHLDKFLTITQSMKQNGVTDDALRLYLFPYSLTHHATTWFDHLPKHSIPSFQEMASKFLCKYFRPSMATKLKNDIYESLFEAWERYKLSIDHIKSIEKYELGEELLKEPRSNCYSGRAEEDVVGHIAKVFEILDPIEVAVTFEWIKIPSVDKDELRLHVFSKSLSGDAKKWWNNEGTATTWKESCDKFFHKYYPLSHTYKNSKIPDDLNHGMDYFKFLYRLASKFENYWELDKNVKSGLCEFYVNGRNNGTIDDFVKYNEENSNKTCSDLFFKPYLDAQDGKDIYEIIDRDYSPIPIPAHHDISKPNELCQTEEFTVIRYSVGSLKNTSLWIQAKLIL
nr:reverse transcriptase domain-containing protein [Tanacetum cinerariifolium]